MHDLNLIQQCKDGNRSAFSRLVSRYQGLVFSCCRRFADHTADVQDLVQETFLRVYQDLHQLRDPARFPQWLRQVATRTGQMWLRRRRSEPGIPEWDDIDPVSPEDEVIRYEIRDLLMESVDALPDDQQVVVKLHYLDDWSYQEISEILDLPQTTIKTRLHRARRHLKKALLRRFATEASLNGHSGFVTETLAGLSDEHRQVAHLHYVTGLSNREIAAWQNSSTTAVRVSLFKARRQLQNRLLGLLKEKIASRMPEEDKTAEDLISMADVREHHEACDIMLESA